MALRSIKCRSLAANTLCFPSVAGPVRRIQVVDEVDATATHARRPSLVRCLVLEDVDGEDGERIRKHIII